MSRAWFDGDWIAIVGECACPEGMFFDDNELQARNFKSFSESAHLSTKITSLYKILKFTGLFG